MRASSRSTLVVRAAGFLLTALWVGCSTLPASDQGDEGFDMVVTQVPHQPGTSSALDRLSPAARYPAGSRIVLVPSGGNPDQVRILSRAVAAAGAPDVSPAADAVLFAGRTTSESNWAIFEVHLRGFAPRSVVEMDDTDCTDPAYLAHDRLVFACRDHASGSSHDAMTTWSLYTASRNGSRIERISFGAGSAFDPTPLRDGRILFSLSQAAGVGRADHGGTALFTVNPDGSLLDPFTGSHRPPALKFRARETADRGVVFLATDRDGNATSVERVELYLPRASRRALLPPTVPSASGSSQPVPLAAVAAEPLPGGGALIAGRRETAHEGTGQSRGIFRLLPNGRGVQQVFDDPGWDEVEALPLVPMPAPKGRPTSLDRTRDTGALLCYDTQRSDGVVGPASNRRPTAVVVHTLEASSSRHTGGPGSAEPANSTTRHSRNAIELGRGAVESDGSFFIEVPADTPIRVRTLGADGREIATSAWFWVRPGEVRACFGCHESRRTAPVNRQVQAVSHPPRRLERATQQARL